MIALRGIVQALRSAQPTAAGGRLSVRPTGFLGLDEGLGGLGSRSIFQSSTLLRKDKRPDPEPGAPAADAAEDLAAEAAAHKPRRGRRAASPRRAPRGQGSRRGKEVAEEDGAVSPSPVVGGLSALMEAARALKLGSGGRGTGGALSLPFRGFEGTGEEGLGGKGSASVFVIESGGRPLLPNVAMQAAIGDPRLAAALEKQMRGAAVAGAAAAADVYVAVFARRQPPGDASKDTGSPFRGVSPLDPDVTLAGDEEGVAAAASAVDVSDTANVEPAEGNESMVSSLTGDAGGGVIVQVEPVSPESDNPLGSDAPPTDTSDSLLGGMLPAPLLPPGGPTGGAIVRNVEQAADHLEDIGCLAKIVGVFPSVGAGAMGLLSTPSTYHLRGVERIKRGKTVAADPLRVEVEVVQDEPHDPDSQEIKAAAVELASSIGKLTRDEESVHHRHFVFQRLHKTDVSRPGNLAYLGAWLCLHGGSDRSVQSVLEQRRVLDRVRRSLELVEREVQVVGLQRDIRRQLEEKIGKDQQRYMMMEKLRILKKQLGLEKDDKTALIQKFRDKLEATVRPSASPEVVKAIEEELDKMGMLEPASSEFSVSRNYLEWLTALPWGVHSPDVFDIPRAREVLDAEHHGLSDVKERILEFIAVSRLRGSAQGKIVCLVGPPGVGKTSIARSIAKALGREYYRFSVGGLSDVAEIKGHRRTYIGAMPGKLVQCLKAVKTSNPLILIDEIDKLGQGGYRGDPSSALLEVLDPEQNRNFSDHYLDVPLDLSKVLFMCTANMLDTIPGPLLDRMEIIRLSGYVREEKEAIARRHLEPEVRKDTGVGERAQLTDAAVSRLIEDYCREAGVRNLKNHLEKVYRKVALKLVSAGVELQPAAKPATEATAAAGTEPSAAEGAPASSEEAPKVDPILVDASDLEKYCGQPVFQSDRIYRSGTPAGVVTGLAWTAMGGSALYIEAATVERAEGKGALRTTGQLGDVMKESASIAHTFARAFLPEVDPGNKFFSEASIHVHVPAGAVPKDGPSAGCTIITSLLSLALNRPVRPDLGMTGEVTITGLVLPVGGVREKCIAAKRTGLKLVVLPDGNRRDWEEIPTEVKEGLEARFVHHYRELYQIAFVHEEEAQAHSPPAVAEAAVARASA